MSGTETGVGPVSAAHRFDEARLATWLRDHLPGAAAGLQVRQFRAGQSNPTFLLDADGGRFVLRKKPPGQLLPSAHQVEREYRVMAALADTDVPVPRVRVLCEDEAVIGTPFYVMDHVDGRVFDAPALPGVPDPAERGAMYDDMNRVLANLHAVDWQAAGLEGFGRPGGYIERQVRRWGEQYDASRTGDLPEMDKLRAWLGDNLPDDDVTTIAHGDYRLGNLVFAPDEPRVVAVLDWELATLGHPMADLAFNCLQYRLPPEQPAMPGLAGLDLATLGIPDEAAYVRRYAQRSDRDAEAEWRFYLAFAFFRFAAICQGVYARSLAGNAAADNAGDFGELAALLARTGWDVAREG